MSAAIGLRVWTRYSWTVSDPIGEEESWLGLLVEMPLQAEFFLSDHSSLVVSFGPSLLWNSRSDRGSKGSGLDGGILNEGFDADGLLIRLGGGHGGGLGYTYYF